MESKFKIGDEIVFMDYTKPSKETIKGIAFYKGKFKGLESESDVDYRVEYSTSQYTQVKEENAFATKKELIDFMFGKL